MIDNWLNYVGRGNATNPDVILGSESKTTDNLTKEWNDKWEALLKKIKNPKDSAHNYVKSLVSDTSTDLGKKYDRLAQTRIFTSYGFTQMMYSMAITDGKFNKETEGRYAPTGTQYMDKTNSSKYPEMLNEQNILMPRYCDRMLRNLNLLFTGRIPESEWKGKNRKTGATYEGFEANWKGSLYFYNSGSKYANEVWSKAQNYLPQSK